MEDQRPMQGPCLVCMETPEEGVVRVALPGGGEHFQKALLCNHRFCISCLAQWIHSCVEDNQQTIRCPQDKCPVVLFPDDVERLGNVLDVRRYQERRSQDHKSRLAEVLAGKENPEFLEWVSPPDRWCLCCVALLTVNEYRGRNSQFKANCKACPSCSVIVERSKGW
jgi:hypothetical protein